MAKIFQQDVDWHAQTAVFELKDHMLFNGQVYDKDTLLPIPYKELNLNVNYEHYMEGKVSWFTEWKTNQIYSAPTGNIYFTRGTSDIENPTFIVDSVDSNVAYIFPPPNNNTGQYQSLHKLSLDPLAKMSNHEYDLNGAVGSKGMFFLGQNDNYLFVSGVSARDDDAYHGYYYAYARFGRIDKTTMSFANCASDTPHCKTSYVCQDDSYYYVMYQTIYNTNWMKIARVDKSANNYTDIANHTMQNTGIRSFYHHTQALELTAGKKSVYMAEIATDVADGFNFGRFEVDMTGGTGTYTDSTFDFTTISGGRSATFVKPTQTGEGQLNLEAFAIEDTSSNYVCMLPTERDFRASEASATFRLYIFKIDDNDSDNLIYKDHIDTNVRAWNVFQVQDDWKKIAIIHSSGLKFYNWNSSTETFDFVQDTSYDINSVIRDANDRIWIRTAEASVHMISSTSPTRVVVTMENSSYNYQGSDISTYANVSAYDIDNTRIVANVKITLEGAIYFTDSSQSKTVTTSSSGETQVNMTIKGSSYTRVLASVVV